MIVNQVRLYVAQQIKEWGFPYELEPGESYPPDSGFLTFPLDLTTLTDHDLGNHLSYWIKWANKARRFTALAEIEARDMARIYKLRFTRAKAGSAAEKPSERTTEATLTQEVIDAEFDKDKAVSLYQYIKSLREEYLANYQAINREINRRRL